MHTYDTCYLIRTLHDLADDRERTSSDPETSDHFAIYCAGKAAGLHLAARLIAEYWSDAL